MEQTISNEDLISNEIRNSIENLIKEMGIKNHTMDITEGSLRGDNYMGIIIKVVVKGEKNGKNTTVNFIVKSAPKNEGFREFAQVRPIYDREIYVYSKIFPIFAKLQEDKGILTPFKPFAKFYVSTMKNCEEALIMEDMKALGFSLWDRRVPLDYNHAMLVMRAYGKLHALSFAIRDQQPELFKELSENTEDVMLKHMDVNDPAMQSMRDVTNQALNSLDPFKDKVAYNKFKSYQENMLDRIINVVKSEPVGKYAVITHGDCWINNMLFNYTDSSNPKTPTELCLLDWQLSRLGSPALDLSYFIFTCTDNQLRDAHYEEMIQEYYNSLKSFLSELGSDPEKMFPFEVLQEQLKKFSGYGLYMAIMVLQLMTSEREEIPDLQSSENVNMIAENLTFTSKNADKYTKRIRHILLDYEKFGYEY